MNRTYRERDWRAYWFALGDRATEQASTVAYFLVGYVAAGGDDIPDVTRRGLRRLGRLHRLSEVAMLEHKRRRAVLQDIDPQIPGPDQGIDLELLAE